MTTYIVVVDSFIFHTVTYCIQGNEDNEGNEYLYVPIKILLHNLLIDQKSIVFTIPNV